MHTRIIPVMLLWVLILPLYGQQTDSLRAVQLDSVTVTAVSLGKTVNRNSALAVEVVQKDFLTRHFTGNLTQALEYIPGVRSMDIGSGFAKPMIRGMAFNRISVVENGIKQEGQQWGSDHGLEIDAFNIDRVYVRKGPASLQYGSDAMGGVIEIMQTPPPAENSIFGEAALLAKTVNGTLGYSLMAGLKKDAWLLKLRYSEQYFGDYRVPTDSIVYLTRRIPIYGRKLKNTAGRERNANLFAQYSKGRYLANYSVSNVYQKTGFFPGAHGIPDESRVQDDSNSRNIELPYSRVNHFKFTTRQQYAWDALILSWNGGFQNNHREEWSEFHTHYGSQAPPATDPDKELGFSLNTFSSSLNLRYITAGNWDYTAGWDMQYQQNRISGYSFLLPRYDRFTTGGFVVANWRPTSELTVTGGLRYDYGNINVSSSEDPYLEAYLRENNYDSELIEQYRWRSYPVKRNFGDFSGSVGLIWNPANEHQFKVNIGHSFRLPGANELAANGVHHGTFRHEQGDPSLSSERGWQADVSYQLDKKGLSVSVTPFFSWYSNYIYLKPTGEWSVLPHAGQIYRYTGTEAVFAGAEMFFSVDLPAGFNYSLTGEYVYTYNKDERIALNFSPPPSMRNTVSWENKQLKVYTELHSIAKQNRIGRNESPTAGANLVNLGGTMVLNVGNIPIEATVSLRNLLNTKYYNHLSFYRQVEIPEPGRNIQLLIKIPFKSNL